MSFGRQTCEWGTRYLYWLIYGKRLLGVRGDGTHSITRCIVSCRCEYKTFFNWIFFSVARLWGRIVYSELLLIAQLSLVPSNYKRRDSGPVPHQVLGKVCMMFLIGSWWSLCIVYLAELRCRFPSTRGGAHGTYLHTPSITAHCFPSPASFLRTAVFSDNFPKFWSWHPYSSHEVSRSVALFPKFLSQFNRKLSVLLCIKQQRKNQFLTRIAFDLLFIWWFFQIFIHMVCLVVLHLKQLDRHSKYSWYHRSSLRDAECFAPSWQNGMCLYIPVFSSNTCLSLDLEYLSMYDPSFVLWISTICVTQRYGFFFCFVMDTLLTSHWH